MNIKYLGDSQWQLYFCLGYEEKRAAKTQEDKWIPVKIWEKKERQGNEPGISPGNVVWFWQKVIIFENHKSTFERLMSI